MTAFAVSFLEKRYTPDRCCDRSRSSNIPVFLMNQTIDLKHTEIVDKVVLGKRRSCSKIGIGYYNGTRLEDRYTIYENCCKSG